MLGGKGSNQAVAAALGGARTAMIGRVGADAEGERARAGLTAKGVEASGVSSSRAARPAPRGSLWRPATTTIIVISGANHRWPAEATHSRVGCDGAVVLASWRFRWTWCNARRAHRGPVLLNAAPAAELPTS